jgi:outer membrane murein-binding lipoprotein Lpp
MSLLTMSMKAFEAKMRNIGCANQSPEQELIAELATLVIDLSMKVDRLENVRKNEATTDTRIGRSFSAAYTRICSANSQQGSGL